MTTAAFTKAVSFTLSARIEGGLTRDAGGITNMGLSDKADGKVDGKFFGWSIVDMTRERAEELYYEFFWKPGKMERYPAAIAMCMFDTGVNSWIDTANKLLQQALGGLVVDGHVGPKTLAALDAACRTKKGQRELVNKFCDARLAYLKGLNGWKENGNGWSNRIRLLRAEAVKLI